MRRRLPVPALALLLTACPPPEPEAEPGPDPEPGVEPEPAHFGPVEHITHPADEIAWDPGPPSLPEGADFAVLEGDPGAEGMFVMRLRFPDGYEIPPHWHPAFERVTVVEGTFHLGMGDAFDEGALEPLPEVSFTVMPPGTNHFARADGETVIQLTSMGPWEIEYIDPADDPRL